MGANLPKQYLRLLGKTLLEHTLERLLQLPQLEGILVMLSPEDEYWQQLSVFKNPRVHRGHGGAERAESVMNGLQLLESTLGNLDWVLVHDAARPCVTLEDILNLAEKLEEHLIGGILGAPVIDTIKRLNSDYGIEKTSDRSVLWRAFTPQMFRFGVLKSSLERALNNGIVITDESSAIEAEGYVPLMVEGRVDNIKVTRPEDLPLAEFILTHQLRKEDRAVLESHKGKQ